MPDGEPILGVIGGAGVGAAARLYELITVRVRTQTGALPRLALWNLPLSDALEHAFTSPRPPADALAAVDELLAEAFDRLAGAGASVVVMPCNSLQPAAVREAARRGVPFIDMIEETARAAGERAVLIATEATIAGGFYDGRGVEMIAPGPERQREVGALIKRAVAGELPGAGEMLELVEGARRDGATVVLGCTDLCGLLEPREAARLRVVESLGVLADAAAPALAGAPAAA